MSEHQTNQSSLKNTKESKRNSRTKLIISYTVLAKIYITYRHTIGDRWLELYLPIVVISEGWQGNPRMSRRSLETSKKSFSFLFLLGQPLPEIMMTPLLLRRSCSRNFSVVDSLRASILSSSFLTADATSSDMLMISGLEELSWLHTGQWELMTCSEMRIYSMES